MRETVDFAYLGGARAKEGWHDLLRRATAVDGLWSIEFPFHASRVSAELVVRRAARLNSVSLPDAKDDNACNFVRSDIFRLRDEMEKRRS